MNSEGFTVTNDSLTSFTREGIPHAVLRLKLLCSLRHSHEHISRTFEGFVTHHFADNFP